MRPICLFPFLSFQYLQTMPPFPSLQFLLQVDVVFPFLFIATIHINLGYILLQNAENSFRLLKCSIDFIEVTAQICLQIWIPTTSLKEH